MTSVLISGASIAGPALAYWLKRHGFSPTVVERAPGPRPGGQAIDIRGVALEVIARMGLREPVEAQRTRLKGTSALDADGNEVFRSEEMTFSAGRFDSGDIEILRDDLAALLRGAIADVPFTFDETITGLTQDADGVDVTFEEAAPQRFDLVIGADGLNSRVRRLAFDVERDVHHLDAYVAIFSMANLLGLEDWQVAIRGAESGAMIYPARNNSELRIFLGFGSPRIERRLSVAEQKALVAERCAELKGDVPRLLPFLAEAKDFYFGAIAQVRTPHWSQGRVGLVGDAGYCPSPMSGQGTSLALVGAYVLAEELARAVGDHAAAFAKYEQRMRPFVTVNQALAIRERPDDQVSQEAIDAAKNAIVLDAAAQVA